MKISQNNEALLDYLDIQGRKITWIGKIYKFLCVITLGILHIICGIFPNIKIFLISKECKLKYSDCVLIFNKYKKVDFRYLKYYNIPKNTDLQKYRSLLNYIKDYKVKVLDTEYGRFIYNHKQDRFVISKFFFNEKTKLQNIFDNKIKQTDEEENIEIFCKDILYGKNHYNLRLNSYLDIFIENTCNLTVFINIFCTILYIKIDYKIYAFIVSLIFFYGHFQQIYTEINIKKNLENSQNSKYVMTFRNKKFTSVNTSDLYPGDLICINPCKELFCDAVLLKGDVITDESFLTGESVPICKSSSQRSVIYSGTSILRSINVPNNSEDTNSESLQRVLNLLSLNTPSNLADFALGVVVGTGFNTLRGKIMKDIINPKPVHIDFLIAAYESIKHLAVASFLGSCLLFYYLKIHLLWDTSQCWTYALDLFFSLASPTLYASLNIGMQISNINLKRENISCLNLERIYLGGNVEVAIFDKTGTLTSDGMELILIDNCVKIMKNIKEVDEITRIGLSACHSVYELEGKYSGDTLDLEMLIFSESKLKYDNNNVRKIYIGIDNEIQGPFLKEFDNENEVLFYKDKVGDDEIIDYKIDNDKNMKEEKGVEETLFNKEITILETEDFTSESRMMSVIVFDGKKKIYFCKGSPDKIGSMIKNKPEFYDDNVRDHSLNGYRVLAMAYKDLSNNEDLKFLCFIVFSNKLKPESCHVIKDLRSAEILTNVCTGDNILTAISVSRECGIIDENTTVIFPVIDDKCKTIYDVEWVCFGDGDIYFDKAKLEVYKNNYKEFSDDFVVACEGATYEFFYKTHYKNFILEKGRVFARFSPAQKKSLVEDYRNLNKNVLFCGDGANDSGAIATADVGIALAQNEASLASSFCAANIDAVPLLIKECRNAYATSLGRYKFVVITNFLVYFNLLFLVIRNKFFTDFQSLYLDIILIFSISYYLTNFKRSKSLSVKKPNGSYSQLSLIRNLIHTSPMILSNLLINLLENSYQTLKKSSKSGTYIFFINSFQNIFIGLMVSDCAPFREGILANRKFLFVSCLLGFFNFLLLTMSFMCPKMLQEYLEFEKNNIYDFIIITSIIILNGLFCLSVYTFNKLKK
ncbi:cation-transporting ATPase [Vairimorpha necatrix]|uniref:Cation-transporting ATPase n=1 Tax=Vairimorpha necatrix TaxID=6039 RepID=A0AAX4JB84_9MICR